MIMKINYKILIILLMLMLLTPKKMVRIFWLTYTEFSGNDLISDLNALIDAHIEKKSEDSVNPVTEIVPVSLNPNENGKNIFANRYRIIGK
jgi:hypothetical protein